MKTQTLSSVSVITLQFPTFGNPNAEREIEITFDFEASTVAWRNRVFKVSQRLISVRKVYSDKGFGNSDYEYNCVVISVESAMKLMMKTVRSFKQANTAINFLNELVGTVLVSNWEIDERDTVSYNLSAIQPETDNTRDAQQVLELFNEHFGVKCRKLFLERIEGIAYVHGNISGEAELSHFFDKYVYETKLDITDKPLLRGAFADYLDSLHREGVIHNLQRDQYDYVGKLNMDD